jgi:glycosyltransferase involved in cell wall biosynthesis
MIPTYNSGKYLESCLRSVLDQDPGPDEMQIGVVDNCSTEDDPEALVADIGKGRVSFIRQPRNVGPAANFTTCIREAKGHWVHILHADDMLLPGFYSTYRHFIETHPSVLMVFGRAVAIDENNDWQYLLYGDSKARILENPLVDFVTNNPVVAPTAIVSRAAYEKVGGFASVFSMPRVYCAADWEMWTRIAALGSIGYIGHPYLLYRVHNEGGTHTVVRTGEMIADSVLTIEIASQRLPANSRDQIRATAIRNFAGHADAFRAQLQSKHEYRAALRQAVWALRLKPSVRHIAALLYCAFEDVFCRALKFIPVSRGTKRI